MVPPGYKGTTARGRVVMEDSLAACVEAVAFVANKDPAACVTRLTGPDTWYVYESQAALDVDEQRGVGPSSPGWFASVECVDRS